MLCLVSKGTFVSRMSSPSKDNLKCCRLLRPTLSTCVLWNNHPQEVGISKGRPSPRQGPVKVVIFFGNGNFDIMQRFVWCVADLTSGRRLALGSCFDPRHHGRHVVPLLCIGVGFSATCMTEKDNPTSQVLILEGWILCTGRVCFTYLCTTSAISVWWCEVGEVTIHNHDC